MEQEILFLLYLFSLLLLLFLLLLFFFFSLLLSLLLPRPPPSSTALPQCSIQSHRHIPFHRALPCPWPLHPGSSRPCRPLPCPHSLPPSLPLVIDTTHRAKKSKKGVAHHPSIHTVKRPPTVFLRLIPSISPFSSSPPQLFLLLNPCSKSSPPSLPPSLPPLLI